MSSSISGSLSGKESRSDGAVPVAVGEILAGKYRVDKVLGVGAMGVVVAATHIDLQEVRALKFMLPTMLGNGEGVERFLREARAAARLRSPHVAKVHDVGRLDSGAPYIVMEYLEGADLKTVLEERRFLPAKEAVRYLLDACDALAEAHGMGIVHRDLKPANLFIAKGPKGEPCLKVLDFGIAKMAAPPGAEASLEMTRTSEILGTPVYMAPEQMRSMRNADARTDIWALGVILFRALSGRRPFKGQTITEVCAAVMTDAPPPIAETRADLPPGLEAVVLRCLEKDPAQRFQQVIELAAALAPFVQAEEEAIPLTELDALLEDAPEGEGSTRLQKPPTSVTSRDLGTARAAVLSQDEDLDRAVVPPARGMRVAGALVALIALGVAIAVGFGARGGAAHPPSRDAVNASGTTLSVEATAGATATTTIAKVEPTLAPAPAERASAITVEAAAPTATPTSSATAPARAAAGGRPAATTPAPAKPPVKAPRDAFGDERK